MKHPDNKQILAFFLLGMLILSIPVTSVIIGPQKLIDAIGIEKGYALAFVVSYFAGFSAITSVSFYTAIISFISGGLDPWLLGAIAGLSVSLGDIVMFYFCRKGRSLISGRLNVRINRYSEWFRVKKRSRWIPCIALIYFSVIPLPNDWLLLFLASIRYPHKKIPWIILLGDLIHVMVLTQLAGKGVYIFG